MAGRSLSVEQQETAVTGHNLANVNNPAYARQQLTIETSDPLETSIGDEGTGVQATAITQVRSALLDAQIQAEGSVSGSLTAQQSALQNAESYLNEQISGTTASGTSSPDGLAAGLSSLFGALQTLSTDPSNIADRQAVTQAALQLTQQFNSVSAGLTTVTSDLNSSIQSDVISSNEDLTQIASLNQQIINATNTGGSANDLVDLREKTIEDLAGKVSLTATPQANGAVNIAIGGVNMVISGTAADSLQTYADSSGNLLVQSTLTGAPLALSGGSIEGSITARDGAVAALQGSLNGVAGQLITQMNLAYTNGYDLNGNTGQPFFTGTSAANIGINSAVASNPSAFQASGTGAAGNNSVVLAMAKLATQSLSGLGNQTLTQNYADAVSGFGSSLQSVNDQLSNSASVSAMLSTQRSAVSGVDTDTEMTNLMQFQKAYEASAELITTLNQMLETVISMKTV